MSDVPHTPFLNSWRSRGMQLSEAMAQNDPAFREKLEHAKARRREIAKRIRLSQSRRPEWVEQFSTYDSILTATRGFDTRRGN